MTEIKKKTWPGYFNLVLSGKKKVEIRLADFDIKAGDTLVLEEYDPETKTYSGRTIKRKAKSIIKFNPTMMHRYEDMKDFGFYIIDIEDETNQNNIINNIEQSSSLNIQEAQTKVDELIQAYGGYWQPLSMLARLVEETGELSRAMNIKFGNKKSKFEGDGKEVEKEMSDVLITLLAIANMQKIDLSKEFEDKLKKDFEKCKGVYDTK